MSQSKSWEWHSSGFLRTHTLRGKHELGQHGHAGRLYAAAAAGSLAVQSTKAGSSPSGRFLQYCGFLHQVLPCGPQLWQVIEFKILLLENSLSVTRNSGSAYRGSSPWGAANS